MMAQLLYGVDCTDALKKLPAESAHCCVTSPPYWGLRDYGVKGQLGLEKTPEEYAEKMVKIFREVKRVLRKDGTLWVNMGDSYACAPSGGKGTRWQPGREEPPGSGVNKSKRINRGCGRWGGGNNPATGALKPKDLVGIPWLIAFALRSDGWYLRQDIIWSKPNPMPESVRDRCTKAHEYVFLLSKSSKYFFDADAIKEDSVYKRPPAEVSGWDKGPGDHRKLVGRYRKSEPKGSFHGKTGDKACRAIVEARNKRSVWTVCPQAYKGAHFATFPTDLIIPMIQAGCPQGGVVLDPFSGSGTTGEVALGLGRKYIGIDLNKKYEQLARDRIGLFALQEKGTEKP